MKYADLTNRYHLAQQVAKLEGDFLDIREARFELIFLNGYPYNMTKNF